MQRTQNRRQRKHLRFFKAAGASVIPTRFSTCPVPHARLHTGSAHPGVWHCVWRGGTCGHTMLSPRARSNTRHSWRGTLRPKSFAVAFTNLRSRRLHARALSLGIERHFEALSADICSERGGGGGSTGRTPPYRSSSSMRRISLFCPQLLAFSYRSAFINGCRLSSSSTLKVVTTPRMRSIHRRAR